MVAGAAGVGKSRLARELVARTATEETVAVATASASSREVPLGAFAPWLNADDEAGAVSALARVGAALRAEGPRMLLLVDDAHMLDDVSATLVHQLAVEHAVRLVLTVRTGEPCPEAITAVWKDGVGERLEMEPLAPDEAADLLSAALGGPLDAQTQRRLHDTTRGNVLWLRHLVDGERAAQRLVAVDGHWEWHGPVALSPALEHLLVERIGTLDEGERRVLDLVALGEPVGLGLLTELATAGDVERVAERELIRVVTAGARSEVHLAHPLYGEVTRARLSVPRARRLRGEISRALRTTGARRAGDDLRRAVLDLDSDTPPDATLLMLAAEQAMNLTDFALAERLLRAAADGGGGFDAHLGLGFLLAWMMRAEEAETALATATAAAATEPERARAVLARAHVLMFILDRGDDARALLDREGVDAAGAPLPESLAFRAALLVGSGDVGPGIETATSALDGPGASPQTSTWACWAAAYGEAFAGGQGGRVRELVARGMDAARRAPELGAMLGNLGFAEILDAGYSGVLDGPSARLAWVDDLPGQHGATWSALYHGRLALEAGRAATARRLLESILPTFPGHGGGWTAWFHAMIAQARAQLGDADGAAESLRHGEQTRHPELRADEGDAALAHVWIAAARGSAHEAVAAARRLSVTAASRGQRAVEMVARHAAVQGRRPRPGGAVAGARRDPRHPARPSGRGPRRRSRRPGPARPARRGRRPGGVRAPPGRGRRGGARRGGGPRPGAARARRRRRGPGGCPGRALRGREHPGARAGAGSSPGQQPRAGSGRAGRRGSVQPSDRGTPARLGAHRREPHLPRVHPPRPGRPRRPRRRRGAVAPLVTTGGPAQPQPAPAATGRCGSRPASVSTRSSSPAPRGSTTGP